MSFRYPHHAPEVILNRWKDGKISSLVINQRDCGELQGVCFHVDDIKGFVKSLMKIPEVRELASQELKRNP